MSKFNAFMRTAHLVSPIDVRDDKVLASKEKEAFLDEYLIVEEKIDGMNIGFSFDRDGKLLVQHRKGYIQEEDFSVAMRNWVEAHLDSMFDVLGDKYIMFGEWMREYHSVEYTKLADMFIGFDIFDKEQERFLSVAKRNEMLEQAGVKVIHKVAEGRFTMDELKELINQVSAYGVEKREGVVMRVDSGDWAVKRSKLVRQDFVQNIVEHWSTRRVTKLNRVG